VSSPTLAQTSRHEQEHIPSLKLVTKVGGRRDEAGAWLPAQTPEELREGSKTTYARCASSGWTSSTSVAHLEENLAAIDVELDADDLAELDAVEQVGRPMG
jgi:hypothetical protein